jgi:hypothetical protein
MPPLSIFVGSESITSPTSSARSRSQRAGPQPARPDGPLIITNTNHKEAVMAEATRTLKVDLDTTEAEASAKQFGAVPRSVQPWGSRSPREVALQLALDSVCTFDSPPSPEHIVQRAETFHAFLAADADLLPA